MLILVTGFEPFSGAATNASWEAVRRLPAELPGGLAGGMPGGLAGGMPGGLPGELRDGPVTVVTHLLPVSFTRAPRLLADLVDRLRPDAVVCVGVAAGRREVCVETRARNLATARGADEDGDSPLDVVLTPAGPDHLVTTLSVDHLVRAVAEVGVPVRRSEDAGLFVCNATYHALLEGSGVFAAERVPSGEQLPAGEQVPGVFVHVPAESDLPTVDVERALEAVVRATAQVLDGEPERPGVIRVGAARARLLRGFHLPEARAVRIGVTGGIGSGKSAVSSALADRGAVVADADALARDVVAPGTPGLAALVAAFGADVLDEGGALDRAHLGELVFSDPAARAALEAITHPLIAAAAEEILASAPVGVPAVYDVPLLVENDMADLFDVVVMVDAPREVRVQRLVARGLGAQDALSRMSAQAGTVQRRGVADIWIDNTGTPDDLRRLVDRVLERWLGVPRPRCR